MQAVRGEILKNVRVDSLTAPRLCAKLRTDAVLTLRVDLWEQLPVLWNQSGRPMTTVQLKAALVDSTGALLWSASRQPDRTRAPTTTRARTRSA